MQIRASARRTALVAAPVLVVVGFWVGGGDHSGAGAALGVGLVVLFFAGGRGPMFLANSTPAGQLFLLIALGYVLRVVLLLVVFVNLGGAAWLDRAAVATTVIGGALLWTAALVHAHLTSAQPTLVIAPTPPLVDAGVNR